MQNLAQSTERIVAFAGAGASAIPPSRIPGWTAFNDLLLESLCERLAAYSRNRQPTDEMLATFRARRDGSQFFAPDFQAQLIEEEVGADYFGVWKSIATQAYGPVHAGLAELAERGRLAAIITPNFDQLFERALEARGQPFRVFHDRAAFEALPSYLAESQSAVPIIKIHGSLADVGSLVDTLRQRVAGRPPELNAALQTLLQRHPWMFLGFSGADFNYDRNYLGVRDAAPSAVGFTFVARDGAAIEPGVAELVAAYGDEKADVVRGDLRTWVADTFGLPAWADPNPSDAGAGPPVKARIVEWVEQLGPMAVVNILCSMLKSSGMDADAFWLLRKTWKSYRDSKDADNPSYARYHYNFGMSLFDAGLMANPLTLAPDMSNLIEWKRHADQDAYQFLGRAYGSNKLLAPGAYLGATMALRGNVGHGMQLLAEVTDAAIQRREPLEYCDVAIASAVVYDIVQFFRPPIEQFRGCLERLEAAGDEPRRATICALLGRFLTYAQQYDEAGSFLNEADRIAERLDLRSVRLMSAGARGLWLADSGTSPQEGVYVLSALSEVIRQSDAVPLATMVDLAAPDDAPTVITGRNPARCRVLLDLTRAALLAGDADVVNRTLDELDEYTLDPFLGYRPHFLLTYAQCMLTMDEPQSHALAAELIDKARALGNEGGNPWVREAADHYAQYV
jgi:NAD-dependent SIR2 family protein deacetylase